MIHLRRQSTSPPPGAAEAQKPLYEEIGRLNAAIDDMRARLAALERWREAEREICGDDQ